MRKLTHIIAGLILAGCQGANGASPSVPSDAIVSTSLCGDSYLLALAPNRAAALSWQSQSDLSRASSEQQALPQISDRAEDILAYREAYILYGPGEGFRTSKFANDSLTLTWGEDFETVWENMEALQAGSSQSWKLQLAKIQTLQSQPKILYLSRAGGTAGPGTFVDAVITAAGGQNVITAPGWFTPDPEALLAEKPDIILTSFFGSDYASVNDAGYRHKAVVDFISDHPKVNIPGSLWPCAGPGLVEAAERLARELKALESRAG